VDTSIGLLDRCRRKVRNEPELAQTRLLMADPHKLPFESGSFDRVIYVGELTDFRDPEMIRAEMLRVVKPDGLVFPA
jgi:ArsR family transcriptional regulator